MQTYMQLRLADGTLRHVQIGDWGTSEEALRQGTAPFSTSWIATAEGSIVQLAQVVEVRRVDLDDKQMQALHNPA